MISKNIFNIWIAQTLKKLQIYRRLRRLTAENGKSRLQYIAMYLSFGIFKNFLNNSLAQILKKVYGIISHNYL